MDRQALDALLAEAVSDRFSTHVASMGVASETALRHLLDAAKARLNTNPVAAAAIHEGAAELGNMLRLRDAKRHCSEVSVDALGKAG